MAGSLMRRSGPVPQNAMVLAAGHGMRMRPLTLERPKPLLELGGKTLLDHALDRLASAGVTLAVVNAHYLAGMVTAHLNARSRPPATRLLLEPEALETGGGVRNALPVLGRDRFYVVNADIYWTDGAEPALLRLTRAWDGDRMDALLLLVPVAQAIGYEGVGDYDIDAGGRLRRRHDRPQATYVFAGVHLADPRLFREAPAGAFSSTVLWDRAERQGRLFGLVHDGDWYHIGTPQALAAANQRLTTMDQETVDQG